MLQVQWKLQRYFSFAIIWQFRLLINCISRSFLVLYHILLYLLVLLHLYHCLFLYFINYHNIWYSGFYHVITLYGEIPYNFEMFVFNYIFWFMFIPKPCHTESQLLTKLPMYITSYTIMPPFVLITSKFATFTHYMRYSLISCTTHPTKG